VRGNSTWSFALEKAMHDTLSDNNSAEPSENLTQTIGPES